MIKINLGCGRKTKEGFVNCDINKYKGVDKVFNINEKWDLKDESVDYLICEMALEHVQDLEHFLQELYRVLKISGQFKITTINSFFWKDRIKFMIGQYSSTKGFHIDHCWLFKPSELKAIFRQHCFRTNVDGHGLLPYANLFFDSFALVGHKCSKGGKK